MKKRLRKKFHTGEYTEFEFPVAFRMVPPAPPAAVEAMLGAFLDQVEVRKLVGGGGHSLEGDFSFVVASNRPRVAVTDAHRQALEAWLLGQPGLAGVSVGPLTDAYGGD